MDNNLNVLVEAKKELLNQLSSTILPSALDCMDSLYADSKVETQGRNTLKMFQEKLAKIPQWNNYQIDTEVGKCVDRCGGCLDEMTAACFVATVKIISSVRLSKDSRKVSLKIPTNDVFVLGVYTNVAKRIYEDPYIYQEVVSRNDRRKDLLKRMDGVVEETVKEMLPINQILKTYLNKNAVDVMNGEPVEPEPEPESLTCSLAVASCPWRKSLLRNPKYQRNPRVPRSLLNSHCRRQKSPRRHCLRKRPRVSRSTTRS